jgi:hypothetical protein
VLAVVLDTSQQVTLRKVRDRSPVAGARPDRLSFTGVLAAPPRVGAALAVLHLSENRRVVTSPVSRILWDERATWIETEHSVYRVTFG